MNRLSSGLSWGFTVGMAAGVTTAISAIAISVFAWDFSETSAMVQSTHRPLLCGVLTSLAGVIGFGSGRTYRKIRLNHPIA